MGDQDIKTVAATSFEDKIQEVNDEFQGPCSMEDLEKMATQMLSTLPKLDRDNIRREMQNMNVVTFQTPTTFDINKGLAESQGYKDRLSEIYNLANREYRLRKRVVEMLFDAANVISKQSSADKRKGEATMKYPIQLLSLEASETFLEEIEQVMSNIKSANDSISRQGSIIQSQIQLGEYRKRTTQNSNEVKINDQSEEMDYHSGSKKLDWGDI
jgi:hypothetical protein